MLRLHSRCAPNVIGRYIGGKVIQSLQFTQDVPTGFQDTSPPVREALESPEDRERNKTRRMERRKGSEDEGRMPERFERARTPQRNESGSSSKI